MSSLPVVIIGSGLAGYTVAREFRKLDTETPILIISSDHGGFYSKPTLSNALATGKTPASIVTASSEKMAEQLKLTVLPHSRVTAIDPPGKSVTLQNGERLPYSQLILALGADPIRLPLEGAGAEDILSVNDLDDYQRLRRTLEGKKEVTILGAGLIGCEFANDLTIAGYRVRVVDISAQPLGRLLPQTGGAYMQRRLEAAGVVFHLGAATQSVERIHESLRVTLANGDVIQTDVVLSAVGLRPRTALAEAAGIEVNRGIKVGRSLANPTRGHLCARRLRRGRGQGPPVRHADHACCARPCGNARPNSYAGTISCHARTGKNARLSHRRIPTRCGRAGRMDGRGGRRRRKGIV